jgi:hypothetical protein
MIYRLMHSSTPRSLMAFLSIALALVLSACGGSGSGGGGTSAPIGGEAVPSDHEAPPLKRAGIMGKEGIRATGQY